MLKGSKMNLSQSILRTTAVLAICAAGAAQAGPLNDRIASGQPIRIGFANEVPFAYPGPNGEPMGFVNAYTIALLERMGHDNIEIVVTDWGGLIPALNAGRIDIVTGGLNITAPRCDSIAFSEPMLVAGDVFIVPEGNPAGINSYDDLLESDAVFVTGSGYSNLDAAKRVGVPDSRIMTVPGPTEIVAAVRAGRAQAGGVAYFTGVEMAATQEGIDLADVTQMPDWSMNWAAIGFHKNDQDFVDTFNAAQDDFLGSDDMMEIVAEYGFGAENVPQDVTTEWVCANR